MANIAHASMTGAEIHEPKGITGAALGTVYVSNGSGSGTWASVGTSSFTGMIADFTWPIVQEGWLELDGSDINTTTYAALYNVMTIQRTGTRTNGVATITSLSSTTGIKVGYYVFGTGISSGTTVLSIDSGTQITMSGNALSSGSSTVIISPWLLNTGTIRLPDLTTTGRFRRSRSATTEVGQYQSDQNKTHTHTGTTSTESASHTHTYSGTTGTESALHSHSGNYGGSNIVVVSSGSAVVMQPGGSGGTQSALHTHAFSGTTATASATHTHTFTTASDGGTETRPSSIVVMTCVKT